MVGAMAVASFACIVVAFIPTDKGQGTVLYRTGVSKMFKKGARFYMVKFAGANRG